MSGGLLVVTAHPDDEALIAGGLLAACADAGTETAVLCLTRGENGPSTDPGLTTPELLAAARVQELEAAAGELGVDWVRCLEHRDGWLEWDGDDAPVADIAAAVREREPAAVVTFGADGLYWHPDHIATCRFTELATADGPPVYASVWAENAMVELTSELAERGLPANLWDLDPAAFGAPRGSEIVDVDVRRFVPHKLRALRAHATQVGPRHAFAQIPDDLAERYLGTESFAGPESPLVELIGAG